MAEKLSAPANRLARFLSSIAPGFFIVGYVIGTGSVTSMIIAGARYGMSLTWALLMSCFFTFIMLVAISKLTIVTQKTIIYNIKTHFGKGFAIFIILGLMVTATSSISGVMAVVAEVFQEWTRAVVPASQGVPPLLTSIFFLSLLLYLFWTAQHQLFLRFVSVMVAVMGIAFILTNFLIIQEPITLLRGLIPSIPTDGQPHIVIAGIVGTTMAAVVIVSRSSVVAEKKWGIEDLWIERRDSIISMSVTFLVSAAIMASAAGTLFRRGIHVDNAIEMVETLEPLAGNFAISVFVTGILAAGLSSIFPNIVLLPWLICDYKGVPRALQQRSYRIMAFILASMGLTIPIFGGKPIVIMIASQAFSPVMMPLLIILVFLMLNNKRVVGDYRNGIWLNLGLITTFIFSLFMFFIAVEGYLDFLK